MVWLVKEGTGTENYDQWQLRLWETSNNGFHGPDRSEEMKFEEQVPGHQGKEKISLQETGIDLWRTKKFSCIGQHPPLSRQVYLNIQENIWTYQETGVAKQRTYDWDCKKVYTKAGSEDRL